MKKFIAIVLAFLMMSGVAYSAADHETEQAIIEAAIAMRRAGIVQFNFRDMDLTIFVRFMSEILQENIVIASGIKEKITIISSKPVTLEEARKMMISVLGLHNLTLQEEGSYSIIRQSNPTISGLRRKPDKASINVTERLGITSKDIAEAMKNTDTEMAIRDAASLLKAVFDNQLVEPKLTKLTFTLTKGRGATLSYVYGYDWEKAASQIVIPESSDLARGRLPVSLLEDFAAKPLEERDRTRLRHSPKYNGLEIQWIHNNSLLHCLGLQRGDVITSVNNIKLISLNDIDSIIHSLMKHERLDLELVRGEKIMQLNYDVVSDDVSRVMKHVSKDVS